MTEKASCIEDTATPLRPLQDLGIGDAGRCLCNVFDRVSHPAKGVDDLPVDAFIGQKPHSNTYGMDHVETKHIHGIFYGLKSPFTGQSGV